jgi:hypothetical protein
MKMPAYVISTRGRNLLLSKGYKTSLFVRGDKIRTFARASIVKDNYV